MSTDDSNDIAPLTQTAGEDTGIGAPFMRPATRRPSDRRRFRTDVLAGLTAPRKTLPSKYFYDAEGSRLFEMICELPEYYLTRTETALLERIAPDIAARIPDGAALVEFGSGASTKTRLLLDAAPHLRYYVPIDISSSALQIAAEAIAADYPALRVEPLRRDFTQDFELADAVRRCPIVGFFPGSTIGNFQAHEASALLHRTRRILGEAAQFIVGADIAKDPTVLLAAYDDAQGVTAAFNMNLLRRMNRELDASFDTKTFRHRAIWNAAESRIEMHLESLEDQIVRIGDRPVRFARGETIHTENSHKYVPERLAQLAARAGWRVTGTWLSEDPAFGIFLLTAANGERTRSH
jgi:dimethylhistidine N-methyltransferase